MSEDFNEKEQSKENESASLKYLSLAFISLIFVIIILAVGTQLIFSPEKVTTWVKTSLDETGLRDKLKEAKIKIEFKKAQTTLTGSLFHPIGVRLSDMKLSADRGCKQYTTSFNSVVVPFGIVEILKGDFKLGTIKLSKGVTEESDVCTKKSSSEPQSSNSLLSKRSFEQKLLGFDAAFKELFLSLQNKEASFNKIQGLLIYDWSYKEKSKSASIKLMVDRFKVYNLSGEFILKGEWGGSISFNKEELDFDGEVVVSEDHISMSSELKYKEGKAFLNHSFERGKSSSFQASVDDMPMSILVSLFNLEKKFSTSFLRSSWLSLKLKFNLLKDKIEGSLDSFDIKTEEGAMDLVSGVAEGEWSQASNQWHLKKPVKFIFTNFRALNLLNLNVQKDLSKLLSNFGKFDLSLTIGEKLNITGAFESSGQSLFVRSGGRVGVQKITSSLGEFKWSPENDFKVRLYQIKLERGEFEGEFSYILNKNETKLLADVRELSLNPGLWKQVFKVSNVGRLSITGEASVERKKSLGVREITSQFKILVSEIDHKLWILKNAEFDCAYSEFLSCNLYYTDLAPQNKLKDWFEEEDRMSLIEDVRTRGEATLQNKQLVVNLFYKRPLNGSLTLNWSIDQGPVLLFPNDLELNLRAL